MRVKLFAPLAGPGRDPAFAGDFLEVSDDEGKDLVNRGFAEVAADLPAVPVQAVEASQDDKPADPADPPAGSGQADDSGKKE